jgi:hypothetical protein
VHAGDEGLDVLTADSGDRRAADGGVDVGAQHRPVGRDAAVRAEVLIQPGRGLGAEQRLPGPGVDERAGALAVLDLECEILGLTQVIAEGALAPAAGPAAGRRRSIKCGLRSGFSRLARSAFSMHCNRSLRGSDDDRPDLPSGGHPELPRGGSRHYLP